MASFKSAVDGVKVDSVYQRNNKNGGRKHLRCFPQCCESGHQFTGFCGRALYVNVAFDASVDSVSETAKNYWVVAVFEVEEQVASVKVGERVSISAAKVRIRTETNKAGTWYRGKYSPRNNNKESHHVVYVVNEELRAWHYGWVGNKHRTHMKHLVRFYLFKISGDFLVCVSTTSTKSFSLKCRRRLDDRKGDGRTKKLARSAKHKDKAAASKEMKEKKEKVPSVQFPEPLEDVHRGEPLLGFIASGGGANAVWDFDYLLESPSLQVGPHSLPVRERIGSITEETESGLPMDPMYDCYIDRIDAI